MIPNFIKEKLNHCPFCLRPLGIKWENLLGNFSVQCCPFDSNNEQHKLLIMYRVYNDLSSVLRIIVNNLDISYIFDIPGSTKEDHTNIYWKSDNFSGEGLIEIDFYDLDKAVNKINMLKTFA